MHSESPTNFAHCRVCGADAVSGGTAETWRCKKHARANPCAAEGCSRSYVAEDGLHGGYYWICRTHWRQVCPPKSKKRQVWNRICRNLAKFEQQTPEYRRLWVRQRRIWSGFVGSLMQEDPSTLQDEVERLFGWK